MNKTILFLLLLLSIFMTHSISIKAISNPDITYEPELTNGLPTGWKKYFPSDAYSLKSEVGTEGLKLAHTNYQADVSARYYGGVMQLPETIKDISDFVFEMDFRFNFYNDTERWIGVIYHAQYNDTNRLSGYSMILRANGSTHQSTISTSSTFSDNNVVNSGIKMTDNSIHKLKIVANNNIISHYLDNQLLVEYDSTDTVYNTGLLQTQKTGGFAIVINKCEIEITYLKIEGIVKDSVMLPITKLANTYHPNSSLKGDIGVVSKVNSLSDLEGFLEREELPISVILNIDNNMNVLDNEGNSIGLEYKNVYESYLKEKIIPILNIETKAVADAFLNYSKTEFNLLDMAVISKNPNLVKHIRESNLNIRGIVDFSSQSLKTKTDWAQAVALTNSSYANSLVLNKEDATFDSIRYIQARFKTVWVKNDEYSNIDVTEQIAIGAYGIICDDYHNVYNSLKNFNTTSIGPKYNRIPYNIAHRGLCTISYENSLEGYIGAYNNGATHIETDVHLSKDGQIVVMHDSTLNRTTNGNGQISQMTYEQISQYQIINNHLGDRIGPGANIPLLKDLFEKFKGKDIVIIVEIKSGEAHFASKLKELLEQYDIKDQVIVISFNNSQLAKMKEVLPEIPTANLNKFTEFELASSGLATIGSLNCAINTGSGNATTSFIRKLAVRGYSMWAYTFDNTDNIMMGIQNGILGITNNVADTIPNLGLRLYTDDEHILVSDFNNMIELNVQTLGGEVPVSISTPIYIENHGNYAFAIYESIYRTNNNYFQIYSNKIKLVLKQSYMTADEMNEILSKQVSELTDNDLAWLEKMREAYDLLPPEEQSKVDIAKVDILINQYNELKNNPKDDRIESPKGCHGSIVSMIVGIMLVFGTLIYINNKKKYIVKFNFEKE